MTEKPEPHETPSTELSAEQLDEAKGGIIAVLIGVHGITDGTSNTSRLTDITDGTSNTLMVGERL